MMAEPTRAFSAAPTGRRRWPFASYDADVVASPPLRVALVDDDGWIRRGRHAALAESGSFRTVVHLHPRAALSGQLDWASIDVLLVDAHDSSEPWDGYIGVQVIAAARAARSRSDLRIVVITGHRHNELLIQRCAHAGADEVYSHDEVRDPESLLGIALRPHQALSGSAAGRRVEAALNLIVEEGVTEVFHPGTVQKQLELSRRRLITLRQRLARVLGVRSDSSLRSVTRTVNRARGVDVDGPP